MENQICSIVPSKFTDCCNVYGCHNKAKYIQQVGGGNYVTVLNFCSDHFRQLAKNVLEIVQEKLLENLDESGNHS